MDYSPLDLQHLANTIYGEAGGEDYNTMLMVGSSAINRLNANKKEFYSRKESPGNNSLINVINKGYYIRTVKINTSKHYRLPLDYCEGI